MIGCDVCNMLQSSTTGTGDDGGFSGRLNNLLRRGAEDERTREGLACSSGALVEARHALRNVTGLDTERTAPEVSKSICDFCCLHCSNKL